MWRREQRKNVPFQFQISNYGLSVSSDNPSVLQQPLWVCVYTDGKKKDPVIAHIISICCNFKRMDKWTTKKHRHALIFPNRLLKHSFFHFCGESPIHWIQTSEQLLDYPLHDQIDTLLKLHKHHVSSIFKMSLLRPVKPLSICVHNKQN